MTVSTETSVVTYIGNDSTTDFTFSFIGVSADDLQVIYTDSDGNETILDPSVYTLVLNAASPGALWGIGGTVTYPIVGSPISTGTQLTIQRIVPYTQDVSISNQGNFYPQAIEQGLDLLELQLQQVSTTADYAIRTPLVDATAPTVLPPAAERANMFLAFDSDGQPTLSEGSSIVGSGTVTSVAMTVPVEFSISGTPITTSGTLAITKADEAANKVYSGPTTGADAQPTFRSLVAADLPLATSSAFGAVKPDNSTITIAAGVLTSTTGVSAANPTATAGPTAINGSAATFMRSDGAPAVQIGSSSQKGILQVDGTTITASAGVISAVTTGGTVTTTGSPTSGKLAQFSGATAITNGDLTGDVTTSGTLTTVLSNSGVTAATYGDANNIPQVAVDAKGRITSASNVAITVPTAANPTATASDTAVNGSAATFMRSDGAPAVQKGSSSVFGLVKVDNSTITASSGVITAALPVGANPTATASDVAVNGSAATFMRSDGSPAIQKTSSSVFGLCKVDNSTITASSGVITATGFAPSGTPFHPGFQASQYYTTPMTSKTTRAITANTLYAIPFYVPSSVTFSKISVYVSVPQASSHIELGIYSNNGGVPNTLEYDAGPINSTSTAVQEITGLTLTLAPGWHFLVMGGDNSSVQVGAASTSGSISGLFLGQTAVNNSNAPSTLITGSWTYGANTLPGTFPSLSYTDNVALPLVYVRL